jgi:hypothetical protein
MNYQSNIYFLIVLVLLIVTSCQKGDSTTPADDYKDYKFEEAEITGSIFHIAPVNGSPNGDGSAQNPWRTLQEVIENGLIEMYQHSENSTPSSNLLLVNEDAPVKGDDRLLQGCFKIGLTEKRLSLLKLNIYIKEVVKKCKGF